MNYDQHGCPVGDKFWVVWCFGGGVPTVQHPTKELAVAESKRLAERNPGKRFYVLETCGFATTATAQYHQV